MAALCTVIIKALMSCHVRGLKSPFDIPANRTIRISPATVAATPALRAVVLIYPPKVDSPAQLHALCAARRMHGAGRGAFPFFDDGVGVGGGGGEQGGEQGGGEAGGEAGGAGGGPLAPALPAWYVVASTNDRICPAEDIDEICAELRALGARCEYQRQKLGAHGFGVAAKWSVPCGRWLRKELGLDFSLV